MRHYVFLLLIVVIALPVWAQNTEYDQNWPQWRGPKGTGEALQAKPPVTWDANTNIQWKTAIPGRGLSTPIVWGKQVILLSAVQSDKPVEVTAAGGETPEWMRNSSRKSEKIQKFVVISVDKDNGKILWQKTLREQLPHEGTHTDGSWASQSPVTDGKNIWASFGSFGIYCLDMTGKLIWEKDLGDMKIKASFGEGSSPALYKNKLIINWDHEGDSFIVVLDKMTGKELWRQSREEMTSWSTPVVYEKKGKACVVVSATNHIYAYNLDTGKIVWESSGMTNNVVPMPVADNDKIFIMSGFRGSALQAVDLNKAAGSIKDTPAMAWTFDKSTPYVPSPLLYKNSLYFFKENRGILSCLNASTGAPYYDTRRVEGIDNVYASPVAANGYVYLVDRKGTTVVLKHGPTLEIAATNKLDDQIDASPAIVGNTIYLRGEKFLYCISE